MTNRDLSQIVKVARFVVGFRPERLTSLRASIYGNGVRKQSQILVYVIVGMLVSLMVVGCSKGNAWDNPGPKESFQTFMLDLWRGNQTSAFEAVWPDDQKWLMAAGDELGKKYPKVPALKPEQWLVVGRVDNPFDIRRVEIVSKSSAAYERGDRVELELHYFDDRVGQAEMVWGGDRWYVSLPEPSNANVQNVAKPVVEQPVEDDLVVDEVDSGNKIDEEALQLPDKEVSEGND